MGVFGSPRYNNKGKMPTPSFQCHSTSVKGSKTTIHRLGFRFMHRKIEHSPCFFSIDSVRRGVSTKWSPSETRLFRLDFCYPNKKR